VAAGNFWQVRSTLSAIATLAFLSSVAPALRAQTTGEFVGRVEGHDFVVEDPSGIPVPRGEMSELLSSGNRLIVRSGQARILLEGGGDVLICGAAQLQVLKSQGAITIALDYGTLRVHEKKTDPVSVFTPLVVATTVAVGGGERDATVGLEQSGQMCIRAKSGAIRVGQQLSGENLLVPQFGGLTLSGGQVNAVSASAPGCTCEADSAKLAPPRPNVIQPARETTEAVMTLPDMSHFPQVSSPLRQSPSSANVGAPPEVNARALSIIMPPLVFNSSNPNPPEEPAVEMVALVRSVRVREDTIIRGTVEPKGNSVIVPAEKKTSDSGGHHSGVLARIGGFFRRLFGGSH
jgi:hypothetical protein